MLNYIAIVILIIKNAMISASVSIALINLIYKTSKYKELFLKINKSIKSSQNNGWPALAKTETVRINTATAWKITWSAQYIANAWNVKMRNNK